MFSLFFYPDPENIIEDSSESICFYQGGSDDPCITVMTGESIVRAEAYGSASTGQIRGPMIVHDFGCAIDDFNLSFDPYIAEETNKMGYLYISLWSGDNATGNRVFTIRWYDSWYDSRNKFQLFEADYNSKLYELDTYSANKYEDWTTPGEDNCTLIREDDALKLYTNGELIYNSGSGRNTTEVCSLSIECLKKHGYSVVSKSGVRSLFFQGHSDDYDDDELENLDECESNTSIWNSDSDSDLMPDGWEVTYGLDPNDPDDAEDDPDYDQLTNLDEYAMETNPTLHNVPPDVLEDSSLTYTYGEGNWQLNSYMIIDVNNTGNYKVKVEYKVGAAGTWYTTRNEVLELDGGENEIIDLAIVGVGLSITCYVRWSVYTEDGEQLYEQYSESKTSYSWWP